jgi:hypothetical protein
VQWRAPKGAVAVNPATVASPAQVRAILAQVGPRPPGPADSHHHMRMPALTSVSAAHRT